MKKRKKMKLSDNEKRDIVRLIEEDKNLPEKYRFLLFDSSKQVELRWNGKSDEITNIDLPFQIIEQIDEPRNEKVKFAQSSFEFNSGQQTRGWTNKLIWGDNKYILASLNNGPMREEIEKEGGIKLIYIDPPFDVGANFSMNVQVGDESYEKKPNILEHIAYRDTWGLGSDSFLSMIYERLILMKNLLSEDGSIYVHCDWRMNSNLRIIMDEIFGKDNFCNEIIWSYQGSWVEPKDYFPRRNNSILFYKKNRNSFFERSFEEDVGDSVNFKRWKNYIIDNKIYGKNMPVQDKRFQIYIEKFKKINQREILAEDIIYDFTGSVIGSVWNIKSVDPKSPENLFYPTQKPLKLIERIIKSSSKENDIVCDFFSGSGSTAHAAELLNRKWICSDLGKFAIHTCRKRMISVQRKLKKDNQNWRAFQILNLGKYQRQHYIYDGKTERDENKINLKRKKEYEFKKLILGAYKSTEVDGFETIHGKKNDSFVSIGSINQPVSRNHIEELINECLKNKIISVDILGFEYEMGLFPTIQEEAKSKGIRLAYKQIPMEVFDKRAVSKNEVIFHDVAYIEFKPIFNGKKLSIELTDFAVFYNENHLSIDEDLSSGKSKIIVENGQIIEKKKDKNGIIKENILTKNWYDWIDYWSVDFNYESRPEIIKFKTDDGKIEEEWTGNYIFENEWQSFRTKKREIKLELKTSEKEILSGKTKVAVKVIDIFGNDTMKVLEVKI